MWCGVLPTTVLKMEARYLEILYVTKLRLLMSEVPCLWILRSP